VAALDFLKLFVAGAAVGRSDPELNTAIGYAAARLDPEAWGDSYEAASAYLAGHMLLRSKATLSGSGAGAVTAEATGGLSRSYAQVVGDLSDAALLTTAPGAEFVQLRRMCIAPAFLIEMPTDYKV
jgi:hypothetical protein